MHFYTSVNMNYLPKARVLAKSVKKYCKNAKFSLVFSDIWPEMLDKNKEPFDEIICIEEMNFPIENLKLWIFGHTVVELCTAVKGQALVRFLEEGSKKVVYLDPDIAVFNSLHEIETLLDQYDIILTPHLTEPERDMKSILDNEISALMHGAYNFGFYGVRASENGLRYARWWRDRLIHFCYDDIPNGIFTDQKWGDLIPSFFDQVLIIKDPGYNVSTWNISNRKMKRNENGQYMINDTELKFYHFSGFDSGAQEEMLRKYAKDNPHIYELREWYAKKLQEEGQEYCGRYVSSYLFYDNGERITKEERKLLIKRKDIWEHFKDIDPYVVEQAKSYKKWLCSEGLLEIEDEEGDKLRKKIERLETRERDLRTELEAVYLSKAWRFAVTLRKIKKKIMGGAI